MGMQTLLRKLGLGRVEKAGEATPLEKITGALHLSLDSIAKADVTPDERTVLVNETMGQFRAAADSVLKAGKVPKVREEGEDIRDEDEDEDEVNDEMGEGFPPSKGSGDDDDIPTEEDMENVKKMEAELVTLTKRLTESEERVAKFEQAEADRQIVAKAEKLVAGTAVPVEQAVTLLKSGGEAGEAALTAILKSTREAMADAQVFKELGSAAGVTVDGTIEAMATDLRKANPSLTKEQAIAKAYRENPALYDAAIAR